MQPNVKSRPCPICQEPIAFERFNYARLNQNTARPCWACRLLQKLEVVSSGCWEWRGAIDRDGYGVARVPGQSAARVHRVVYEMYRETVAKALHLDHLCRNRACSNPFHLEAVSCGENIRRGNTGYPGATGRDLVLR